MKVDVLILGAGPAGTSAAFKLKDSNKTLLVLEKDKQIGGLAKTLDFGEFKSDIGPHRFYSKNQDLYDIIAELLGDDWIKVDRLTRFYIRNKFFKYPVELGDILKNLGFIGSIKAMSSFSLQKIKNLFIRSEPKNFEEKIVRDFGWELANLNMLNYTEKIWGLKPSEISVEWATQRIKNLSVWEILKKMLFKKSKAKTLVDAFYYPRKGTQQIYERMREEVEKKKGRVFMTNSYPVKIIHKDGKIVEVIAVIEGKEKIIHPKYIISTIPITRFIELLHPRPSDDILNAIKQLKFRSLVTLFIAVNKEQVFPDQWIYLPELSIPFGRMMEIKNFSKDLVPKGKTLIGLEFFCWYDDKIWRSTKGELLELAMPHLEKAGFLKRNEVINTWIHKERFAYPVYDINYAKYLTPIKSYLNSFENLIYVGRGGRFKYNNQDHAIEMGFLAAKSILNKKRYDIDAVGSEKEYLEKGYVK